jgi:hypothetical protein
MQPRMRMLTTAMVITATVVGIYAVFANDVNTGKTHSDADLSTQSQADFSAESPLEKADADVDEIAKSKIEILKNQNFTKKAAVSAAANAVAFDAREEAQRAMSRLIATRKCERVAGSIVSGNPSGIQSACPTDHPLALATASGYSDLLTQQTVNELAFLKQLAIYARSERHSDPFDLVQVAKVYIQHPDDNVKEQALEIAALLQDRDGKEALTIATKAIDSTVSGPLALQALSLLSLHRDFDQQLVDKTVTAALKDGGWHVRDAVASQLLLFITPSTRAEFVQILAREPVRSKVALHIRLNLEEFDRMERL